MVKKILTVGFSLSSGANYSPFEAKISLLDWDIILFLPNIADMIYRDYSDSEYQGKLCLSNEKSFRLREACAHWRREIAQAFEAGKLVLVFLSEPKEVFVATGTTSTSGTGRNQKVTRHVEPLSNYAAFPISTGWTATQGSSMSLVPGAGDFLISYWKRFESESKYNVVWNDDAKGICITTRHGQKPVGMIFRSKSSPGAIVLLPELDFERTAFFEVDDNRDTVWTAAGQQFSASLISEAVSLSKAILSGSERTPEPDWAISDTFALVAELELRNKLLIAETELERVQSNKDDILTQLADAGQLRRLLYEKGKGLESAVLSALSILGFEASQYRDGVSEFDAIFASPEGRLLGEAEGKDNKAVNIDKLRQLSMNIYEDLQRDEVTAPAKGILFGNGYRLSEPKSRGPQFTDKCIAAATAMSIGLVRTDQLYEAAKHLSDNADEAYACACRMKMLNDVGLIDLPAPPAGDRTQVDSDLVASESSSLGSSTE